MSTNASVPFFVSIPHAGEEIPKSMDFLNQLPKDIILCDIDRFVDVLYQLAVKKTEVPCVQQPWHRYVVDANRTPDDIDCDAVAGNTNPSGAFTTGFHWVKTTTGKIILAKPLSQQVHEELVQKCYLPFHEMIKKQFKKFKDSGFNDVYHLDLHSMPSKGTAAHRDPGETRAEIVVSDFDGKSASAQYRDLVVESYKFAGFEVKLNWPYKGGKITQIYGLPAKGQHTIQVEMRRSLYMDEETKELLPTHNEIRNKLTIALSEILSGVKLLI